MWAAASVVDERLFALLLDRRQQHDDQQQDRHRQQGCGQAARDEHAPVAPGEQQGPSQVFLHHRAEDEAEQLAHEHVVDGQADPEALVEARADVVGEKVGLGRWGDDNLALSDPERRRRQLGPCDARAYQEDQRSLRGKMHREGMEPLDFWVYELVPKSSPI